MGCPGALFDRHRDDAPARPRWLAVVPLLAFSAAASSKADAVQTLLGRLEGKTRLLKEQLQVGGKAVRWDDLLYLIRDQEGRSIRSPQAVRLVNGELWFVDLLSFSAKKLKVRFMLFGEREIDADLVSALDFLPDLPSPEAGDKPGTLYREKGEPIPGPLLWVERERFAIDSPLGVLTLKREGTARYLFRHAAAPPPAKGEEISLADGTTLRGQVKPVEDGVELEHAVLGRLSVPARALRSVLRRVPAAVYLTELAPKSVRALPLVANPAPPEILAYPVRGEARTWPGEIHCLRGIRIQPKTVIEYRLPRKTGSKAVFTTTMSPLEDSRGDVRIRIASGGKALLERDLVPEAKREAVSLNVPAGAELAVEVDFGPRIAFPCGVLLGDPHVVMR